MKKLFTLSIAALSFFAASAQSPRLVLVEEGSNASCGPCAAQNPGFHTLLEANTDNVISVKYQAWWPGYDPMYLHNTADVTARINYYGINGVPTATLDGEIIDASYPGFNGAYYAGAPAGYSQATMDNAASITSPFEIEMDYSLTPYSITVNATATATGAASGNLRFHVVVVEKEILFDSAPGTNGETAFYNVMKKMLPSATGTAMASSYAVGETFTTTQSWNMANIYDYSKLAVVVFIQNNTDKSVLQAAYSDDAVMMADSDTDIAALEIGGLNESFCSPTINPTVTIRNHGANNLTSATINYTINDATGSIDWTGDLGFFETTEVSLGEITFTPDGSDDLEINITNPNNGTDELPNNNEIEFGVNLASETSNNLIITIVADNYGNETYWRIINEQAQVIAFGGNPNVGTTGGTGNTPTTGPGSYTNGSTNNINVALPEAACYTFEIYDYYGDGICCAYGNGSYTVKNAANNEVLLSGGSFAASDNGKLLSDGTTVGIEEVVNLNSFAIYPNPTNGVANLNMNLISSNEVRYEIYDITGKRVAGERLGRLPSGAVQHSFDVSNLNAGIYIVNIVVGDEMIATKLSVQ